MRLVQHAFGRIHLFDVSLFLIFSCGVDFERLYTGRYVGMPDVPSRLLDFSRGERLDRAGTKPRLVFPLELPGATDDRPRMTFLWLVGLPPYVRDERISLVKARARSYLQDLKSLGILH